jgi:hypothetical protein
MDSKRYTMILFLSLIRVYYHSKTKLSKGTVLTHTYDIRRHVILNMNVLCCNYIYYALLCSQRVMNKIDLTRLEQDFSKATVATYKINKVISLKGNCTLMTEPCTFNSIFNFYVFFLNLIYELYNVDAPIT